MGMGDVLLLYTDGLSEHSRNHETYVPQHLEGRMREVKHGTAREIYQSIREHVMAFASAGDDVSLVVIKRSQ
jgi:serine phosphatase RsbU (regulator of sigma subunit)